ncbi:MAG: hypothetical protein H6702_06735 [Myxococcales bacterium]|nr:hypothetical protein [Myxococcales bacterium]
MTPTLLPLLALLAAPTPKTPKADLPPPPMTPATWQIGDDEPSALTYVGVFFSRATRTNVKSTSDLVDGLLTGRLYGPNGTTTDDDGLSYVEQRYLGFFTYKPTLLDGRAKLKAAFEIDFTFGDASNTSRGNAGAAINGDTVNLQTKRLAADIELIKGLNLVVGLQPLADSAHDPTTVFPDTLMHGGTHLTFWGTDAAGVSLFGKLHRRLVGRVSWFDLYLNQSDKDDDVQLLMADAEVGVSDATQVGLHLWYLRDRSRGVGSALGAGPGSPLGDYNGAAPLRLSPDLAQGDLFYVGLDASYNRWLAGGPLTVSGFAVANFGSFEVVPGPCRAEGARVPCPTPAFDDTPADLLGFLVDLEAAWRWGRTNGDLLSLELLYATGDDSPQDRTLSSVVTGNNYGIPGALHGTHRSLLLFPDIRSVNRQVAVVYDPANLGHGVMAAFLNGSVDLVADQLNLKLGLATAQAAAVEAGTDRFIGVEGNAELLYRPMPFLWFGAHAAVVRLGKFLEGRVTEDPLPESRPWTTYLSLTWVHF